MNDIYLRFKSLPRARRGDKSVVIVDEDVLAGLLAEAQASGAALADPRSVDLGDTTPAPLQIHIDPGPPPHVDAVRIVEDVRHLSARTRQRGW